MRNDWSEAVSAPMMVVTRVEAPGIEPGAENPQPTLPQDVAETKSKNLAHSLAQESQIEPDLARVQAAWPSLPGHVRAAICALVDTAKGWETN
jgi:hypothetical protein